MKGVEIFLFHFTRTPVTSVHWSRMVEHRPLYEGKKAEEETEKESKKVEAKALKTRKDVRANKPRKNNP